MKKEDVCLKLDDIGLFRKRQQGEVSSQYERACVVRDAFAGCMINALEDDRGSACFCVMPELCATGLELSCCHLQVNYLDFIAHGEPGARKIPLPMDRRRKIDSRLRAIGTLVYREITGIRDPLPGDLHIPSLTRVSSFTGQRKSSGARGARARTGKPSGFWGRLLGLG